MDEMGTGEPCSEHLWRVREMIASILMAADYLDCEGLVPALQNVLDLVDRNLDRPLN